MLAALAFQLRIIGDPIFAAIAVQILDREDRVGIRDAVHVPAHLRCLGDGLGDIVGRLGRFSRRECQGETEQSGDKEGCFLQRNQFRRVEAVLLRFFFLRLTDFFPVGLAPQIVSRKGTGLSRNEACIASPSRLVPNSDFQK